MIGVKMALTHSTSFPRMFQRAGSAQFRRPLLHLVSTQESRHRYLTQCVPLHKAALEGDWKEAKKILDQDPALLNSAITKGWATVLHIAVGANHESFVEELLKLMSREDLELQDIKGNTAFCFAAAVGNVHIAERMRRKNASLPMIRGGEGVTPLHLAVLQGRSEMAWYLFDKTRETLYDDDWFQVFLICVNSGLYELALEMLNQKESLAFARGDNDETALHVLARKPLDCGCRSPLRYPKHVLHLCKNMKDPPVLKLTRRVWDIFLTLDDSKMMTAIREPSQVTFIAAEVGNFEFLSVIMSTYPDLIWELNTMGQSIIPDNRVALALHARHPQLSPLSLLRFASAKKHTLSLSVSATATMGASLPPKEANLFKLIVKSYETKQYKKGLKAADAILKKFPDHGETLSMKGLTLNCMDRKSEAYELVRQGLKNDLKSHVCWHVYGLLYRSDREYREAIKCYRNALKIDPDNIEILRDLSLLQAQMRDLTGFVETRQQLLTLKSNHRMNWIGFAVAHHLNSNASKAIEILEAYEGTLEDDYPPENERCEHGEMLLYKISLLEECGFFQKALEELQKKELKIVDKLAYKEQEVSLLVKLAHLEEGEKLYRKLLSMNPDNYRYYEGLQKCVGLYSENGHYSLDEIDQLDALYRTLGQQYKWSSAVKRIPLDFLQGDKFQEAANNYIRPLLTKGIPSLFSDLSSLYNQPGKADILEQIILEIESSIKTTSQYPGGMEKEPPSTLMWTLFLLAQHYDRRGQYEIALSKINEAIDHTPTVIDLYSVKSRILKHAGDLVAAAAFADEARCMDLADRYVNSECVKRMLQADQVALAEKTAVLFTKDGDQHNNLHDMQCMWYELAGAESYFRQGNLGMALKKFLSVEKHYADITEDQFDFHSYCLRKMTLHTYVEMLKFQDQLHSHAYFHKAAAGAIRCYIELHDSPPKLTTEEDNDLSKLLPSQKKKMRQKQRKAEARAKKEAEEKNEESSAGGISKSGKRHAKPVDPDPCGEKLLQVEDPLLEATKYLKLLQKNSPDSLETHFLSFELYMRKQRILLAFQAVKQLLRLDAEHPDSHRCLIKFFNKVGSMIAPVTDSEKLIWSVLEAERQTISQLHGKSLFETNNSFLEKHEDSLTHRAAFGETLYILDPNRRSEAVKLIEGSPNNIVPTNGVLGPIREWKLIDCVAVHKLLGTVLVDQDAALRWKVRCAELFPYSTYFEGSRSSASPNSAFNQIRKSSENGSSNHSVGDHNAESGTSNGKLEAFKDLTI